MHNKTIQSFVSQNESDTKTFAKKVSKNIGPSSILAFSGDLGSGKTFFCREIIQNICGEKINVISPTFNLLQTYECFFNKKKSLIYHFDLYRLNHPDEVYNLGIEEAFSENICLIEWPEIIKHLLPAGSLYFDIEIIENTKRRISSQLL